MTAPVLRKAPTPRPAGKNPHDADLSRYVNVLFQYQRSILLVTLGALLLGGLYAFTATPIYRAKVVLQVEEKNRGLGELEELLGARNPAVSTQMAILSSGQLLGKIIDQLHLDVRAEPRHLPLLGAARARMHHGEGLAAPPVGALGHFAWGGERIRVDRLQVPPELEDEPLLLVAGKDGTYQVLDPSERPLLVGRAGTAAAPAPGAGVKAELFVAELAARPGTQFRLVRRSRLATLEDLQRSLRLSEQGEGTGIVSMQLEGKDPERLRAILNGIAAQYIRQNIEKRSEEAEKTLAFLDSQLPGLRKELERSEQSLSDFRAHKGAVDLPMETQAVLNRSVELEKSISQVSLERSELRQRFTANHPQVIAAERKQAQLQAERSALDAQLKRLPDAQLQIAQRQRDVQVANELYVTLSNKAQEYRVMKSSTVANVRVLDEAALPRRPVSPHKAGAVVVSLLLGLALGVALAFTRRAMNNRVSDPGIIEAELGQPVYATIPLSDAQLRHTRTWRGSARKALPLLAHSHPRELAVESLRSLRTSLQFALLDAANNLLTITGPSPGAGKSFVSVNLAWVIADAGKRVLLVDADLRAGWLHRYFGLERNQGLSEVITGSVELNQAVRRVPDHSLHFLPTGLLPPNPSELLLSAKFSGLLSRMAAEYDLVILDTPPILAVSDGAIVGRQAGVNLLVVRSGAHPMREIAQSLTRLEQNGVAVQGIVFNGVPRSVAGRYANGVYQYDYPSAAGATA